MKSFATSILTPDEVYTSGIRIKTVIINLIIDDPFLTKVIPLSTAALDRLMAAIGRTTNPAAVKLLNQKDSVRDERFITLRDFCKSFVFDTDPALSSAAQTIVAIIKDLGWSMYNDGYATETSLLQALLSRLETAPVTEAITALNATSRLNALKIAQADFETTYNSKVDIKSKEIYPLIREGRVAVVRYQAAMLNYIDMMAEIDGGIYTTAANMIDEIIVEFESIARTRKTKREKENTPSEK